MKKRLTEEQIIRRLREGDRLRRDPAGLPQPQS
jgi:hypothetical protein